MVKSDIYKDIEVRTGGDIYLGVVGPVRTGKSTFIKNFMEMFVIPNISNEFRQDRAKDELPQSAAGRTIMTTEPKFVPNESVEISLDNNVKLKTRLVDCVGYLVDGTLGHMEDDMPRMVKTPWNEEEIPFSKAAEIGTKKVISDHSTVGLVVTTDGSITDIDRNSYIEAEERVVKELQNINKPFVILLNSVKPESEETVKLSRSLEEKYNASVVRANALDLREEDVEKVFSKVLNEFPVTEIAFDLPNWFNILDFNHPLKQNMIDIIKKNFYDDYSIREVGKKLDRMMHENDIFSNIDLDKAEMKDGSIKIKMDIKDDIFYELLSEISDTKITSNTEIFKIMKEYTEAKKEFDKISMALEEVRVKGYGIVNPEMEELTLEEPEIVKQGSKYGVKLKASAPSIHIITIKMEWKYLIDVLMQKVGNLLNLHMRLIHI